MIFSNTISWIKVKTYCFKLHWSLSPKGPIDILSPLVQIMSWLRIGDKPLRELILSRYLWHQLVSLGLSQLVKYPLHIYHASVNCTKALCHCNWSIENIWWRHQMEAFSTLLAFCAGNSPVTGHVTPSNSAYKFNRNWFKGWKFNLIKAEQSATNLYAHSVGLVMVQFTDACPPWINSVPLFVRPEVFHDVYLMYYKCSSGIFLVYD